MLDKKYIYSKLVGIVQRETGEKSPELARLSFFKEQKFLINDRIRKSKENIKKNEKALKKLEDDFSELYDIFPEEFL